MQSSDVPNNQEWNTLKKDNREVRKRTGVFLISNLNILNKFYLFLFCSSEEQSFIQNTFLANI